jgi:hypothetical protein
MLLTQFKVHKFILINLLIIEVKINIFSSQSNKFDIH